MVLLVSVLHVFSFSSFIRPISARMSSSSLSGHPRCVFTLINRVTTLAFTRCCSLTMMTLRTSASVVFTRLSLAPPPIHFCEVLGPVNRRENWKTWERETWWKPWLSDCFPGNFPYLDYHESVILQKTSLKGLILIIKSTYQGWYHALKTTNLSWVSIKSQTTTKASSTTWTKPPYGLFWKPRCRLAQISVRPRYRLAQTSLRIYHCSSPSIGDRKCL